MQKCNFMCEYTIQISLSKTQMSLESRLAGVHWPAVTHAAQEADAAASLFKWHPARFPVTGGALRQQSISANMFDSTNQ